MTTVPTPGAGANTPDDLAATLATVVAVHGIRAVVAALSDLCLWRSHHLRCNPSTPRHQADAWERIGTSLRWEAAITLKALEQQPGGGK
jgi:hypothetical protein